MCSAISMKMVTSRKSIMDAITRQKSSHTPITNRGRLITFRHDRFPLASEMKSRVQPHRAQGRFQSTILAHYPVHQMCRTSMTTPSRRPMPSTILLTNRYVIIGSHAMTVPNGAPPQHDLRMDDTHERIGHSSAPSPTPWESLKVQRLSNRSS